MSSTVTITIETGNAAFRDPTGPQAWGPEIARILRNMAKEFDHATPHVYDVVSNPRDINGNAVGSVVVSEEGGGALAPRCVRCDRPLPAHGEFRGTPMWGHCKTEGCTGGFGLAEGGER